MKYRVMFFRPEEFLCPCCGQGGTAVLLVLWLDLLRRAWGGPLRVHSGRRCERHNPEVGGSGRSRHLLGCAADVSPKAEGEAFQRMARRFFDLPGWELRFYPTFSHLAVPRAEASRLWDGGEISLDARPLRDLQKGISPAKIIPCNDKDAGVAQG